MKESSESDGSPGLIGRILDRTRGVIMAANVPGLRGLLTRGSPPGSLGWPFFGESFSYRKGHKFFEDRSATYGPVFKTHVLLRPTVCFVGPEAFTFFSTQPFFDRRGANPWFIRNLLMQRSLPLIDGAEHAQMRGLVLQAFSPQNVGAYLETIERLTLKYLERWERIGSFSWVDEYKKLSADICAALFGGPEPGVDTDTLVAVLDSFLAGLTSLWLPGIPAPRWTPYGRAIASRDQLLSYIENAIRRHEHEPSNDMLTELLSARTQDGAALTGEQIRAQMLHMYFAAYGGIFRTLTLLSMSLNQHPDVTELVRAEVLRHAETGPVTLEQLGKLTLLNQVTREVRRHHRIFASTMFDRVTESFEYAGFKVRKGWNATVGVYTTMQDPDVFTRPESYDPDRFSPERAENRKKENSYVPQGGGPASGHRCPGEDLTTYFMQLVAVLLLRNYTWKFPKQDFELDDQSTPLPRDGVKVEFTRVP